MILSYDDFCFYVKDKEIVKYSFDAVVLGFAVVCENVVLFMGVTDEVVGNKLLELLEDMIRKRGYDRILLNYRFSLGERKGFFLFDRRGYEDIYIDSDFLFESLEVGSGKYEFRVDDYQKLKMYLSKIDLKMVKNIDFDEKLVLCFLEGELVGYCQYSTCSFEDLGRVGVVSNMYVLNEGYDLLVEMEMIKKVQSLLEGISKVLLVSYDSAFFRNNSKKFLYRECITYVKLLDL